MTLQPINTGMFNSYCLLLFILFATNSHQFHLNTAFKIPLKQLKSNEHCIHSPHRILGQIGCMNLIPNSTSAPVQTGTSSVLMSFDVDTGIGTNWNARILSSHRDTCDLFLMDSATLMPIVFVNLKAVVSDYPGNTAKYLSVSANVTFFDLITFIRVMTVAYWKKYSTVSDVRQSFHKGDVALHLQYTRMALGCNLNTLGKQQRNSLLKVRTKTTTS